MSAALARSPHTATTVGALVRSASAQLATAGVEAARRDGELLVAEGLGLSRAALFAAPERAVPARAAGRVAELVERRAEREPVAYILGRRGFRRLELIVDPRVLIPRPETELLVEVGARVLPSGARVHDVGTGSGAVALALKDERPDLRVSASDISEDALEIARANAVRLGLEVGLSIADGAPRAHYDLIVANLPYVAADEWPSLAPEIVRFEPRTALVGGGPDGLDAIRRFVATAPPGTRVALEHAPHQAASVRDLLRGAGSVAGPGGGEDVTVGRVP
jgi:release factor glutamine methyltransferase